MTGDAADCHVHVLDPVRFPYRPEARYQPSPHETAPVGHLLATLDAHDIRFALVVNPTTGYGTDNRVTEAAIAAAPDRLRGIAVVPPDISPAEMARLKAAGFVGCRISLLDLGTDYLHGPGRRLLGLCREIGMIVQLQVEGDLLEAVSPLLRAEAGMIIVDHMGRPDSRLGTDQPGFRTLISLADRDEVAIKLSGPFRLAGAVFPYHAADRFAAALLNAFGADRCVWGSDWPYVRMAERVDYGPSLAALSRWVPDPGIRRTILETTPRRLFGFGSPW